MLKRIIKAVIPCLALLLLVGCSRPIAQFAYSGAEKAPAIVQFENKSEKADSYEWDFGDGYISEEITPAHKYKQSGIYQVKLKAIQQGKRRSKSRILEQQLIIAPPDKCLVEVETPYGFMMVELYNATPEHQDNFTKLVEQDFYDSLLFHRVIQEFMIQGGDPKSRNADRLKSLGSGGPGYTIPAEFVDTLLHVKGALSAARTGDRVNPEKRSSGSQFYIVQGKPLTDRELDVIESRKNIRYTTEQREVYKTLGGTPILDQNYTVFGQVIEGLEVIDAIADQATNSQDRPRENIWMKMIFIK